MLTDGIYEANTQIGIGFVIGYLGSEIKNVKKSQPFITRVSTLILGASFIAILAVMIHAVRANFHET